MTATPQWSVHGRHPAPVQRDAIAIRWTRWPREARYFVADTCPCRDEKFELWAVGGQRFIRKTLRATGKAYNSDLMRCADANDLWEKLLKGEAR